MRVRRNLYVIPETFEQFGEKDLFHLANVIQTPSVISFATALSFYGLTSQLNPSVIESANPVRSRSFKVSTITFRYYYCKPLYYFGYQRQEGFFIAEPEKALLDILYLVSLGRYALDEAALNLKDIRWTKIESWLKKYPAHFRKFCRDWRGKNENLATT